MEGVLRIQLSTRGDSPPVFALVDSADAQCVQGFAWYLNNGYARRTAYPDGERQHIYLHRELMGLEPGDQREVDHRNLNKLDCRRENMRVCTHAENGLNQPIRKRTSSVHRGVSRHSQSGRWTARATRQGREIYIGLYETELEAARAFQEWASRVGDFHAPTKSAQRR